MHAIENLFEFARSTPDAPAMVYDLAPISYRTFYRMVCAMRRRLAAESLPPGGVVVIWIQSIRLSWLADLALRWLGLTTLSINGAGEFAHLEGLDIVAVVTSTYEPDVSGPPGPAAGAARIRIGREERPAPDDGAALPSPAASVAAGGHILLTSGTTGRPKLILIDPEEEAKYHAELIETYLTIGGDLHAPDRRILMHMLNFGLWTAGGYTGPLMCWSAGGGVIIHQGPRVEESLAVAGITHALITPAYLQQILATAPDRLPRNDDLQLIISSGALSLPLANEVKARLTNRIATGTGSTESGTWSITPVETLEDLRWHRLDPARVVEVVDDDDQPVPAGEVGQVRVLQTNGVNSYLNDPVTSMAHFRQGYFYSGDLGVLDGHGRLMLSGRVTEVLNVKGTKIAVAPVEGALQEALDIHAVCALSEQDADGSDQLHVALEAAEPVEQAKLEQAASPFLQHFTGVHFHHVQAFPRNHMGKVERLKLRRLILGPQAGA